jgi:hypothetical protein
VIQAIPTYAMSVFKFPAGLCAEICSLANRFWWGQRGDSKKIHWLSKSKLSRPKVQGGIGFRDLHLFNMALLARQGWRLLQHPESLVYRVLKAKYFPHSSVLEAVVPHNASFMWRSICESLVVLNSGLRWRVGTGSRICIWKDAWLPGSTSNRVVSPPRVFDENATVDSLINWDSMCWNLDLIRQLFFPRDVELITSIPLSRRCPCDLLIWSATRQSIFTVKSAYNMLLVQQSRDEPSSSSVDKSGSFWNGIWAAKVQPKIKLFIWCACQDILPTLANLFRQGVSYSYSCRWCEDELESSSHILWQCEFAQRVWHASSVSFPAECLRSFSFSEVISCSLQSLSSPSLEIMFTTA